MENKDQKTILVTGATGKQGGAVAKHLLDNGWHVRIITRDPEKAEAKQFSEKGAEIVQGNLEDKNSILRAASGVYGIYSVQSLEKGIEAEIEQGKIVADAAKQCRVRHFVYSSVAAADRKTGVPHFDSKWQIEEYIRFLQLPATIFRPTWFMENLLTPQTRNSIIAGTLTMAIKPDKKLQMIAVDNIGGFVAAAFENPDHFIGQAIGIAGDELTMPQLAQKIGNACGYEVKYVEMPMAQIKSFSKDYAKMFQWFNEHSFDYDIGLLKGFLPDLMEFDTWLNKIGVHYFAKEEITASQR